VLHCPNAESGQEGGIGKADRTKLLLPRRDGCTPTSVFLRLRKGASTWPSYIPLGLRRKGREEGGEEKIKTPEASRAAGEKGEKKRTGEKKLCACVAGTCLRGEGFSEEKVAVHLWRIIELKKKGKEKTFERCSKGLFWREKKGRK